MDSRGIRHEGLAVESISGRTRCVYLQLSCVDECTMKRRFQCSLSRDRCLLKLRRGRRRLFTLLEAARIRARVDYVIASSFNMLRTIQETSTVVAQYALDAAQPATGCCLDSTAPCTSACSLRRCKRGLAPPKTSADSTEPQLCNLNFTTFATTLSP